jgi:CO/xanthine dehydrogenase Mo-binding subunit
MLYGATVRSPHARARILRRTWRPERAPRGAVVALAEDLPGINGIQLVDDRWPALAVDGVCHVGEPVALVAAPTPADARRAAAAVDVVYEPLAGRFDAEAAAEDDVFCELSLGRPSVEAELASAARRVEGVYRTGHQEHLYIECQAMTAWFEDGRLHVVGSMQCPYYVRRSLAHAFGLRPEQVRVRTAAVGGGFGGKEDYPSMIAVHAALLALVAGAPVRLAYDRHEDIVGTTKRHPSVVAIRSGISAEGGLEALDIDVVMDGGAYATLSSVVLSRALLHAAGPYRCPAVRVRGRVARTNTAPNGAFRGFGAPQTQFAIERHMDRIAREVGRDPWEVRWDNALRPGDRLPTGQEVDASTAARRCLERVEAETGFRARWKEIESRRDVRGDGPARGIGLSLFFHGAGFTGNGERRTRSPVTARLTDEGRLEVLTAMAEMGQGCAAIFPQLACEAAGLSVGDVLFPEPDTDRVPDSGPTVASRTTMIIGGTIVPTVGELVERVLGWWASEHRLATPATLADSTVRSGDASWSFREVASAFLAAGGDGAVTRRHEPPDWQVFDEETHEGAAYPTYSWGADVVEVEVDPVTLEVSATEVTSVCDAGRAIHPTLCRGQVEGGTLQSVAWALLEEIKLEEGRYLNDRLATYMIPTTMDSPRLHVHLLETPWEGGPFGAKGIGELPMDGGAPATAAAIDSATGLFVASIPATPEALLELSGRSEARRDAP